MNHCSTDTSPKKFIFRYLKKLKWMFTYMEENQDLKQLRVSFQETTKQKLKKHTQLELTRVSWSLPIQMKESKQISDSNIGLKLYPNQMKSNLMPILSKKTKLIPWLSFPLLKMRKLRKLRKKKKLNQQIVETSFKIWITKFSMVCAVQLVFSFLPSLLCASNAKIVHKKLNMLTKTAIKTPIVNPLMTVNRTTKMMYNLKLLTWNMTRKGHKTHTSNHYQKKQLYMIVNYQI